MTVQPEIRSDDLGDGMLSDGLLNRLAIRELLENWVLWRDAGDWDKFATVWHEDGRMNASWFRAGAADFIARSRNAFDGGMVGLHSLGGCTIEVRNARAVAYSKMQIVQRAPVHGVLVDVVCQGRFADALEKRGERWGMVLRQPIYELDRLVPLDPTARLELDQGLLKSFPEGYRHLGYLQTQLGFEVSKTLPGTRGTEIEKLYARLKRWLQGDAATCLDD